MLRVFASKTLRVEAFAFKNAEVGNGTKEIRRLLGAIINQAMHDGMLKVRVGVESQSNKPFLRYFGPIYYESDKRIWWDVSPASPACYPVMLQTCLSLSELEPRLPVKGVIRAVRGRENLRLQFEIEHVASFEIAWTDADISRREGPRVVIDVPAWEGAEADASQVKKDDMQAS